jgi:hypothetical protein
VIRPTQTESADPIPIDAESCGSNIERVGLSFHDRNKINESILLRFLIKEDAHTTSSSPFGRRLTFAFKKVNPWLWTCMNPALKDLRANGTQFWVIWTHSIGRRRPSLTGAFAQSDNSRRTVRTMSRVMKSLVISRLQRMAMMIDPSRRHHRIGSTSSCGFHSLSRESCLSRLIHDSEKQVLQYHNAVIGE